MTGRGWDAMGKHVAIAGPIPTDTTNPNMAANKDFMGLFLPMNPILEA